MIPQSLRENAVLEEGHGFSRAVMTLPSPALAAEVRFFHPLDSLLRGKR
jgi:hypothetical protein